MALVGVELKTLVSEVDALTTQPPLFFEHFFLSGSFFFADSSRKEGFQLIKSSISRHVNRLHITYLVTFHAKRLT